MREAMKNVLATATKYIAPLGSLPCSICQHFSQGYSQAASRLNSRCARFARRVGHEHVPLGWETAVAHDILRHRVMERKARFPHGSTPAHIRVQYENGLVTQALVNKSASGSTSGLVSDVVAPLQIDVVEWFKLFKMHTSVKHTKLNESALLAHFVLGLNNLQVASCTQLCTLHS